MSALKSKSKTIHAYICEIPVEEWAIWTNPRQNMRTDMRSSNLVEGEDSDFTNPFLPFLQKLGACLVGAAKMSFRVYKC